jgi:multidrug efflux pump subunit AcrA (membrane-fusion protein)
LPRRGNALLFTIAILVVVAAIAMLGWWFLVRDTGKQGPQVIVNSVSRGPYEFVVIEQGEIENANATELKCEVKSRGAGGSGGGISILEVVPEGTMVQPGDILVRLDSSALEQEKVTQQIACNRQEALLEKAKNELDAAQIARIEYLEGTFKQALLLAEQNLRTAETGLSSAQRLAARNIITSLQLEGAQFAADKALTERDVLVKYTKEKMLKDFDTKIATADAAVKAEQSSYQLEQDKLKEIEDQITKCVIRAPNAGQVVYCNRYNSGRSGSTPEFVVEAGATVREQQAIIRLPRSNEMQVKATVNEARITLVRPGLPVSVRIDALKDEVIQGEVVKVNQYAEPGSWSGGNVKKYGTFIKITNPPPAMRSGMNAEVRIHVERQQDALQVPVQALAEHKGHFFALVKNGLKYETREVEISSTNDKVAVIAKGLAENDQVVMNPRGQSAMLELPNLPDPTPAQLADIPRASGAPLIPTSLAPTVAKAPGGSGDGNTPDGQRPKGKGKGKGGEFTPAMMVERALESDADKDGKLSADEMSSMDERRKRMVDGADANGDGFVDRAELTTAAAAAAQRFSQQPPGEGAPPAGGGQ